MIRLIGRWVTVMALMLSIGAHWAVLQSAAWVGMIVKYSQASSVSQAIEKTFDGQHPCKLCKAVEKGRSAERNSDFKKVEIKIDLIPALSPAALPPAPEVVASFEFSMPLSALAEAPSLPPPRIA